MYILVFCVFILSFIAAFKTYKTKRTNAIIFFIAFSFPIVGSAAYIGIEYGIIEESSFPLNPIFLGVGLEAAILSVAMINQFVKIYDQKVHFENENSLLSSRNKNLKEVSYNLTKKLNTKSNPTILLKSKAILKTEDIQYIKSDGHYVEYFIDNKDKPEIDRNSLTEVLRILPNTSFIRIHKSYIVNIYRIKIVKSTKVMLDNGVWINLSRTYKQQLKDILHKDN
jgi:hypothetical protein